mmetsp:Transcript_28730/g.38266  ORF Transcript_28730/g.38266 Transcript_28730/m.38266 type:complete len:129 (-) Transcript_28730:95-481(-)
MSGRLHQHPNIAHINAAMSTTELSEFDTCDSSESVGTLEVADVGHADGLVDGEFEGIIDGEFEGIIDGEFEGTIDGEFEGIIDGEFEGIIDGEAVDGVTAVEQIEATLFNGFPQTIPSIHVLSVVTSA